MAYCGLQMSLEVKGGQHVYELNPPMPPFTLESALMKVQAAEDDWNTRDPGLVSRACAEDCVWRHRRLLLTGRGQIADFLTAQWRMEHEHSMRKSLWAFAEDRIAVRLQYEWRDSSGQWWRSHGNELSEYRESGLMYRREAAIVDVPIGESDRRYFGIRAEEHRGIDIP